MTKKIPSFILSKSKGLVESVNNIKNVVPYNIRTTFNFKGRKSPAIATKVIENLSEPGDIIFDPFLGSGMFLLSSVNANRFIMGTELDNYTFNALKVLLEEINYESLNNNYKKLQDICKDNIMELYETECCGKKNIIKKLLFDPEKPEYFNPKSNREIKNGKNIILAEKCPICENTSKHFDQNDLDKIKSIYSIDVSRFPNRTYIENSRINITSKTGANKYDKIFSNRNKIALLMLQDAINQLTPSKERDFLEHVLVSCLALSRIAMYGSSTDILYHVVLEKGQDINVWLEFERKYNSFLEFKKEYKHVLVSDVVKNNKYKIYNEDYEKFLNENPELMFDMVYTDFPYTDQVPYLERNQLFRIWLEEFYDKNKYKLTQSMLDDEIVLTNAPSRPNKRSIDNYYKDIDKMFKNFYLHLNKNGLVVLTLKLGKDKYFKTYMEIINLARKNGFEYVTRMSIDKEDPTLRKQSAYANTLINEMIVVFYKLESENRYWYIDNSNYEFEITKKIYNHLLQKQHNQPITITTAVKIIENDIKSKGIVPTKGDLERTENILRENFSIQDGFIFIDNNRLYLDIEDKSDLYTKLYDLIPIYIGKLLKENDKFTLEDLYLELVNSLCDGNPNTIAQFLESDRYQREIKRLIDNYCDLEGNYYIEKSITIKPSENSIDISLLDGSEFEILIKRLLIDEGYLNVVIQGGSCDRGVDLIATKFFNGEEKYFLFQCKRWVANVGSEPIQRLYAERERRNYDKAICITTSDYTKEGIEAAKDFDVEIWNGKDVIRLLQNHYPNKYYNQLLMLK